MWDRFRKSHPWLYEAVEWAGLALAVLAFILALKTYLS